VGTLDKLGLDPSKDPTSADAAFYKQGLRDAILDMAADFGYPAGWQNLRYELGAAMQQLREGLQEWESTAGSFQILSGKYRVAAQAHQARAWARIASICPRKGPVLTKPILLRWYNWGDAQSGSIGVPQHWRVAYNFDCRGATDYSNFDGGHFILTVRQGNNSLVSTAANEVGLTGSGAQPENQKGRFYLKVQSDCYWHVRAFSP
jgi:hypothetical protein